MINLFLLGLIPGAVFGAVAMYLDLKSHYKELIGDIMNKFSSTEEKAEIIKQYGSIERYFNLKKRGLLKDD